MVDLGNYQAKVIHGEALARNAAPPRRRTGLGAWHLVPAGSMFAFLAGQRGEVFPDEDYADLFAPPGKGRPSVPATQMAAVMTLQALHGYSDRETAEAVRFDVRWKAAIGAALNDSGFDPSTLVYWRRRLAASQWPHRVNDAVRKVVEKTGISPSRCSPRCHHLQDRAHHRPAPPRPSAARRPRGLGRRPGLRQDSARHRLNVERAIAQIATWRGTGSSSATAGRLPPRPSGAVPGPGEDSALRQSPASVRKISRHQPERTRASPATATTSPGLVCLWGEPSWQAAGFSDCPQCPAPWSRPAGARRRPCLWRISGFPAG
jgi:Transposase domain (DUF772)